MRAYVVIDLRPDKDEVHVLPCIGEDYMQRHRPDRLCACLTHIEHEDGPFSTSIICHHDPLAPHPPDWLQ